jgi:hypothetical protein
MADLPFVVDRKFVSDPKRAMLQLVSNHRAGWQGSDTNFRFKSGLRAPAAPEIGI